MTDAAEDQENQERTPSGKITFATWCERNDCDPVEVEGLARYLKLDGPSVARLPMGDPAWLTRLRQQVAQKRKVRGEWSAVWAQRNVGPDPFRKLTGKEIFTILPPRLKTLTKQWTPNVGALIVGPTGICKTMAATFMARRTVYENMQTSDRWHYEADSDAEGRDVTPFDPETRDTASGRFGVVWVTASALARARRGHPLGKGEPLLVTRAMECRNLFLDDIGWEPLQDMVVADVLSERYDRGLSTVATAGFPETELSGRYGAALIRRIIEAEGRKGFKVNLFESQGPPIAGVIDNPMPPNERGER